MCSNETSHVEFLDSLCLDNAGENESNEVDEEEAK